MGPIAEAGSVARTNFHGLNTFFQSGDYFFFSTCGDEYAGSCSTGLPAILQPYLQHKLDSLFQVGIIQDDGGRLSAQLQGHTFQRVNCVPGKQFAYSGGTRERDLVDSRITGDLIP